MKVESVTGGLGLVHVRGQSVVAAAQRCAAAATAFGAHAACWGVGHTQPLQTHTQQEQKNKNVKMQLASCALLSSPS